MLKAYDDYYDKVASGFLPEMGVEERLLILPKVPVSLRKM